MSELYWQYRKYKLGSSIESGGKYEAKETNNVSIWFVCRSRNN